MAPLLWECCSGKQRVWRAIYQTWSLRSFEEYIVIVGIQ